MRTVLMYSFLDQINHAHFKMRSFSQKEV